MAGTSRYPLHNLLTFNLPPTLASLALTRLGLVRFLYHPSTLESVLKLCRLGVVASALLPLLPY
jgi:hypothetical protein